MKHQRFWAALVCI